MPSFPTIFQDILSIRCNVRSKRSTIRIRRFFKKIKETRKLVASVVANHSDIRKKADVQFLGYQEQGASISYIGSNLAKENFSQWKHSKKKCSVV